MDRYVLLPLDCLRRHWQLLLIASLPGSALRVWTALHPSAPSAGDAAARLAQAGAWHIETWMVAMFALPVLVGAALLVREALGDRLPTLQLWGRPAAAPKPGTPRLDTMTLAARELLAAVSPRGEFRLVPRLAGDAVVAPGTGANDDREFYDPANRDVSQRYRHALVELERAGLLERDGETRRLSAMGWPAARLLTRQELDRLARRARHLAEPEQRLLRLIADCRQRYKVDKIMLRRDGSAMGAVFGNGQTVPVADVCPLDELFPGQPDSGAAARFEALVAGIPDDYLVALPERRLGNPFVLRLTDTGLRYLRYADVVCAAAA